MEIYLLEVVWALALHLLLAYFMLLVDTKKLNWLAVNSLPYNTYDEDGNFAENGPVKFVDSGPKNMDNLIKRNDIDINMEICKYKTYKCWGTCEEGDDSFNITIANDQESVRDFVATITHEMVHVKQYVTGKWKGTGEREASNLQYKLTDKLWKENIL